MVDVPASAATVRNVGFYLAGVGAAVAGALGLADAIALHWVLATTLFVAGLVVVLGVHEYLGGPIPTGGRR